MVDRVLPGLALMIAVFCFNLLGMVCATSSIRSGGREHDPEK
jgi:O-antigen ligase